MPEIPESFRQYLVGMERYQRGEPVDACENIHQRRGWWRALRADAESDVERGDGDEHELERKRR